MIDRRLFLFGAGTLLCARLEAGMTSHAIYELRSYILRPGKRDTLTALFEREFIEMQEAAGARIVGTFHDLDDPDRFVWIRSFASMATRLTALTAIYGGPVWRAHREAANATMIDSDDVYLLRPHGAPPDLPGTRPPLGAVALPESIFAIDIFAERDARPLALPGLIASFVTEGAANDFPALPVRDDRVFVTLRRFSDEAGVEPLAGMPAPLRTMRLRPTARSLLR